MRRHDGGKVAFRLRSAQKAANLASSSDTGTSNLAETMQYTTTRTVDSRIQINRFARSGGTPYTGRPNNSCTIEMTTGSGKRDVDTYSVNVQ